METTTKRGCISYAFNFEAAHRSPEWPVGHPNSRVHGHSYIAELIAEGEISDIHGGTIMSAERLRNLAEAIKPLLDHHMLNEIDDLPFTTMEHIAHWILIRAKTCHETIIRVRVSRPTLGIWVEAW